MLPALNRIGRFQPLVRGVRWGSGAGEKTFEGEVKAKGLSMIAEATVVGFVFAFWWRYTHSQEKKRVNDYYVALRASKE